MNLIIVTAFLLIFSGLGLIFWSVAATTRSRLALVGAASVSLAFWLLLGWWVTVMLL